MSVLREKLHALVDEIVDAIERRTGDDWLDQNHSPLGKNKHLSLAKRGVLPASKEGRKVFIRRSDIDAYLAKKRIIVVDEKADEEREVQKLLASFSQAPRTTSGRRRARKD